MSSNTPESRPTPQEQQEHYKDCPAWAEALEIVTEEAAAARDRAANPGRYIVKAA